MPHKKNPILSENLTGLARIVRAAVTPALENIALWHERDISHSAVERVFAPDATIALDFALTRLAGVVDGLVVDGAAMRRNLESRGGLVYSQRVLLALIERGMSREEAYAVVQEVALGVWEGGGDFEAALGADARVAGRARSRRACRPLCAGALPQARRYRVRPRLRAPNERNNRQSREWTVMIEMQDHIAVITGAGSGFGQATALRLAREGDADPLPGHQRGERPAHCRQSARGQWPGRGHRRRCLQRGGREGGVRSLPPGLRRLHAALRQCRLRPALAVRRDERRGVRPHGGGAVARRLPLRPRGAGPDA